MLNSRNAPNSVLPSDFQRVSSSLVRHLHTSYLCPPSHLCACIRARAVSVALFSLACLISSLQYATTQPLICVLRHTYSMWWYSWFINCFLLAVLFLHCALVVYLCPVHRPMCACIRVDFRFRKLFSACVRASLPHADYQPPI
jgi:hypothetical protein